MIRPKLPRVLPKLPKVGYKRPGAAPGTLVHVGRRHVEQARIDVLDYTADTLEEHELTNPADIARYDNTESTTWINVTGLHDADVIAQIGRALDVHPLVLEDLLNTEQRPKVEDYGRYAFVVLKMLQHHETAPDHDLEQVSLLVFPGLVITFQERPGDVFDPLRERIRNGKGRIRHGGSSYLAYALVDTIVDQFAIILDHLTSTLAELEDRILDRQEAAVLEEIHDERRRILALRKIMGPTRDLVGALQRGQAPQFDGDTRIFLRDVEDHATRALEMLDLSRETAKNLLDLYLSLASHRTNEVMKVLTIIATIFIPLTFIAGVYGMNFAYMPELEYPWGYPAVWLIMLATAASLLTMFRRRGWL